MVTPLCKIAQETGKVPLDCLFECRRDCVKKRPRTCIEKVRHPDEASALLSAKRRSDATGLAINVYLCPYCDGWHLTKLSRELDDSAFSAIEE